jgi:hypothetical protein
MDLFPSLQAAFQDRYALERELGRGGMATVYLARDLKHPRHVAIKVLRPELAGVMTRGRFLREIRISAELSHPHILPLLDSGSLPPRDGFGDLPYYTMPYVEGESLQERLRREKQLPLEDALGIARDVADALAFAHRRGVVHRDIKPGNILLTGGHALVADFGIARALREAVDPDAVTSAGVVIGTPAYMSPEQAGGETDLDGRSDIYSLACVLYEMLGGEPPFIGSTPHAVIARHRMDPAPSLRTLRSTVPASVEQAIKRALEKSPADRFATAEEFADALRPGPSGSWPTVQTPVPRSRHRTSVILFLAAVLAVAGWYLGRGPESDAALAPGSAGADTTRYAIVSFGQDSAVPTTLHPALLLQDALGQWSGVQLVDPFQVRDAISRSDTAGFRTTDWVRLATSLGAGRYIRAGATRVGDSIRIEAVLYGASGGAGGGAIRNATVRLPVDLAGADAQFAILARDLLLARDSPGSTQPAGGTTSLPARQAFDAGASAIDDWDLDRADSSFAAAVRFDPEYAQANLWLALVRKWAHPHDEAAWRAPAEHAEAGRPSLATRDGVIAQALVAEARGDFPSACARWRSLSHGYPYDFVVWYGLAECVNRDRVVIRDQHGSPTGWRFRSSFQEAMDAYQRAYTFLPSILTGFRDEAFAALVRELYASDNVLRLGRAAPPDSGLFSAYPAWEGDSLVFWPFPYGEGGGNFSPATREAIRHQQRRLNEIARAWVSARTTSADALQALAVSLQLLGDRSALDTVIAARRLARDPGERIRVGSMEVWMRIVYGAPRSSRDLLLGKQLADSLLAAVPAEAPLEPKLLASLAALTGRANLAARLGRQTPLALSLDAPPWPLTGIGITFLTYAALGGPADSLRRLSRTVTSIFTSELSPADRRTARMGWFELPLMLAFPTTHEVDPEAVGPQAMGLLRAEAALSRGDSSGAWQALRGTAPSPTDAQDVRTVDIAFPEAWLAQALGHPDAAAARLDAVLNALPRTSPQLFLEINQSGTLVRAMALRAEVAERLGDHNTAKEWAGAVVILWSDADEFLQPLVDRMRRLAK